MSARRFATAVVTATSPLALAFPGDDVHTTPAEAVSTYTPAVDDVVRCEVRRGGLLPLVLGKVT